MLMSYAKGARTWERHIDIPYPKGHKQKEVSKAIKRARILALI